MISNVISRIFGNKSDRTLRADMLHYFLLIYDAQNECLADQRTFEDAEEAEAAFFEAEREYRGRDLQVLLFGSDSIETVQSTHPHYFRDKKNEKNIASHGDT